MSTLTLTLRQASAGTSRIDVDGVTPDKLAGLSERDIASLSIRRGVTKVALGELFDVSGTVGDTLVFAGTTDKIDNVGTGLKSGTVIADGNVGAYAGRKQKNGRLTIKGSAGDYLASKLAGGLVTVSGNAGDFVGGIKPGEKFAMAGGTVVVDGDIGSRAGDRMRRGTIIVKGKVGDHAASRMMGGTIWTEGGFGNDPGPLLRRGTLIGPSAEKLLATFTDSGRHDLVILQIMWRHLDRELGPLAPQRPPEMIRKLSGDMAEMGKGELLLLN
jgi:formylmethanofuran dehydrogenase subunit C